VGLIWQFLIGVVVLIGLGFWLRGYWKPLRRAYQHARSLYQAARRVRTEFETVGSGRSSRPERDPSRPERDPSRPERDPRVVDVSPRPEKQVGKQPTTSLICPVCNDSLNEAQLRALRSRSVRCPGSSRVGRACPYYGERELN
jgi:hypothetical protein